MRFILDGLVSKRYRLDGINEDIANLKQGRAAGHCLVWMDEPPVR